MKEIFKDIIGYEGLYQISNFGNVKSLKRKKPNNRYGKEDRILAGGVDRGGYLIFSLSLNGKRKTYSAHQLVAIYFLNHIPNGHKIVVDHIDNDKSNNNVNNLQLISVRENTSKDKNNNSSKYTGVCWIESSKKWKAQIYIKGKVKHLGYFDDELKASEVYNKAKKTLKTKNNGNR